LPINRINHIFDSFLESHHSFGNFFSIVDKDQFVLDLFRNGRVPYQSNDMSDVSDLRCSIFVIKGLNEFLFNDRFGDLQDRIVFTHGFKKGSRSDFGIVVLVAIVMVSMMVSIVVIVVVPAMMISSSAFALIVSLFWSVLVVI